MKKSEDDADGSFGSPLGDRAVWDAASPDHECDCPGPPPHFYLPPPPRPLFLLDSDCSENSTSYLNTCQAMPVIDADYRYSPAIPSLAIILTVAAVVVVFLLVGTFLVLLKKRKMRNLFPRKSSSQNRCDAVSTNGAIYEDLTNVRPRMVSSHRPPPGQTTLPSIEMMNVASYPGQTAFAPALMCSASPVLDSFDTRELFNPVYEELSNGSAEGGETESEGERDGEDELSLGGEAGGGGGGGRRGDVCRDLYSSDSDDRCKFLENSTTHSGLPSEHRDKRQRTYFGGVDKKDRRKVWRSKAHSPLPSPPVACNEFHEGFLLKRILQIYPDVTGLGLQCSCGAPKAGPEGGGPRALPRRPTPEIFSTFGPMQGFQRNQSQDSSLGSDSGFSNNTSGGKSWKGRKEYGLASSKENTAFS